MLSRLLQGGFELRRTLEKQESGGRNTERRAEAEPPPR